ncbi:hypothetical protein, secreted [gut metagenome]|uniref:HTH luxR-type domain-containing protein n=1 Tax=gut metagenome TaxID=749906 RepID=J9GK31_9ZZZZ
MVNHKRPIMKPTYLLLLLLICSLPLTAKDYKTYPELMKAAENELLSNPKQASYYCQRAIDLHPEYKKPNDERAYAMIIYSQAEQLLGNFDLSIKNLYDTEPYIQKGNRYLTARKDALMSRVYGKLGDYNKAIELNDQATAMFKALGDSASVSACYNERGIIHYSQDEFLSAEQFLQRALTINRLQKNLKGIATNLNNLCLYQGDTPQKLMLIKEAIAINKNLNAQWSLGENYNNMGKQYFYNEEYKLALDALKKAYEYAHAIGARELICDNYEYSSWVYAAIGNYAMAYKRLSQMQSMSKELQSSYKLRNIEQQISYKKIQEQKYNTERQKQNYRIELLKRNLWLLIILLVMALIMGCFTYIWYKRRKKLQLIEARYHLEQSQREVQELRLKQQTVKLENMQNALEISKQEVTNFAVFLRSRNELLDKIKEMLKEGYKMDLPSLIPHLKKVTAVICQYQSGDKSNSNLLLSIEEKSKVFIERLTEKHPNLTQGERHLATLLRVNLSTKEIAMLTGNTPKTINMNRYRLRKSLNLSNEEDLIAYLRSF